MLKTSLLIVILTILSPSVSPFQPQHERVHRGSICKPARLVRNHQVGRAFVAGDNRRHGDLVSMKLAPRFGKEHNVQRQDQKQPFAVLLAGLCLLVCGGGPQLANAASLLHQTEDNNAVCLQEQQRHLMTIPSTTSVSASSVGESSVLLLATYSEEGAGGLPFLSPFQTQGAIPKATDPKFEDADARNRAYDDAFDQDKRDRDAYYAKMAIQSREKKLRQLNEQRAALGLDSIDSGPRFGDEEVASMASLKKLLLQKDPSTMTPAEFKEYQALTQRETSPDN